MIFEEIWHLAWIYNRMILKHKEEYNIDYILKFRSILETALAKYYPHLRLAFNENHSCYFEYKGSQP
jgi:hypothetical protein